MRIDRKKVDALLREMRIAHGCITMGDDCTGCEEPYPHECYYKQKLLKEAVETIEQLMYKLHLKEKLEEKNER